MNILFTTAVFYFIGFITVKGTVNVCIPFESVDVKDTNDLYEDVNQVMTNFSSQPFPVEHLDVDIVHYAFRIKGTVDNVSIYNLNDYNLRIFNDTDDSFTVFNLTFANIVAKGDYNLTGDLGDLIDVFGDGKFWVALTNLSIAMNNFTEKLINDEICFAINIDLDISSTKCHFYHSMGDKELEDLISNAISSIAPESMRIIWSELKDIFDKPIEDAINNFIHHRNLGVILNKLYQGSLVGNNSSRLNSTLSSTN